MRARLPICKRLSVRCRYATGGATRRARRSVFNDWGRMCAGAVQETLAASDGDAFVTLDGIRLERFASEDRHLAGKGRERLHQAIAAAEDADTDGFGVALFKARAEEKPNNMALPRSWPGSGPLNTRRPVPPFPARRIRGSRLRNDYAPMITPRRPGCCSTVIRRSPICASRS